MVAVVTGRVILGSMVEIVQVSILEMIKADNIHKPESFNHFKDANKPGARV